MTYLPHVIKSEQSISKTKRKENIYFIYFYMDTFPIRPVKCYQKDRERSFQRGRGKT
jgi:hypothetical protein